MTDDSRFGCFGSKELAVIRSLDSPDKIQEFIDKNIEYDPEREDRSVLEVIRERKAECFNGALLAAAALIYHGYDAAVLEILARRDEEHVLCVYRIEGQWGSIAQSKYLGLKGHMPRYRTVRDLVASYMELFFAFDGHLSLESYTNPLRWRNYKWLTERGEVVKLAKQIRRSKHIRLVDEEVPDYYVSPERFWSETKVIPKGIKIPKIYRDYRRSV